LKQTSCARFQCFSFFLLKLRFSCSHVETSIFVLYCQQYLIYLLLYVDDIIIIGSDHTLLTAFVHQLHMSLPPRIWPLSGISLVLMSPQLQTIFFSVKPCMPVTFLLGLSSYIANEILFSLTLLFIALLLVHYNIWLSLGLIFLAPSTWICESVLACSNWDALILKLSNAYFVISRVLFTLASYLLSLFFFFLFFFLSLWLYW